MTDLNKTAIKRIAHKSETASGFFTLLAARERCKARLDLRRVRQDMLAEGFKVVPEEFEETFKELAAAGMGKYVRRPGQPPRFVWSFSARDIASIAVADRPLPPATREAPPAAEELVHVVLPSGLIIELPKGLSTAQIEALAGIMLKHASK